MRQKTFVVVLFTFSFLCLFTQAFASDVGLAWDPVSSTALAGYKVYYGTASGSYSTSVNVNKNTSYTVTGLLAGKTYYFAVTAYDSSLKETAYSSEVSTKVVDPAPVIQNVQNTIRTTDSATIRWDTNVASDSAVDYGTGTSYGKSATDGTMVQAHTINLSSLTANTLYHYRVRSKTSTSPEASSVDFTFTTLAPTVDSTPPSITSGPTASNFTSSGAVITWSTNEQSTGQVRYGTSTAYTGGTISDPAVGTTHTVSLTGLQPSTTYHFCVISTDATGNAGTSADITFATSAAPAPAPAPSDTTPPVISGVVASGITYSGAAISWNTNEGATSQVEYGTTTAYGMNSTDAGYLTQHTRSLSGLQQNTIYHYRVVSKDAAGNVSTSGDLTFRTLKLHGRNR